MAMETILLTLILSPVALGVAVQLWASEEWLELFRDWVRSCGRTL
jgi:hypothetical protein